MLNAEIEYAAAAGASLMIIDINSNRLLTPRRCCRQSALQTDHSTAAL